jgi:DNA-binding transcriptional ArsR family regulator
MTTTNNTLTINELAKHFRAISTPDRVRIIELLNRDGQDGMRVVDIQNKLNLKQAIVSQHLIAMKRCNVLRSTREGHYVYYRISSPVIIKAISTLI